MDSRTAGLVLAAVELGVQTTSPAGFDTRPVHLIDRVSMPRKWRAWTPAEEKLALCSREFNTRFEALAAAAEALGLEPVQVLPTEGMVLVPVSTAKRSKEAMAYLANGYRVAAPKWRKKGMESTAATCEKDAKALDEHEAILGAVLSATPQGENTPAPSLDQAFAMIETAIGNGRPGNWVDATNLRHWRDQLEQMKRSLKANTTSPTASSEEVKS